MGLFKKTCLGIDIGMASLKIVAVSSFGKRVKLENYAGYQFSFKGGFRGLFYREGGDLLVEETSTLLNSLLRKAHIKEERVAFSLPNFSTFITTFELPPMTEQEVPRAVDFEAHHHIPLPISEVTFDWRVIKKQETKEGLKMKILLVAVPNKVLFSYQRLAALLEMEVTGMEASVFGLGRAVIPQELTQQTICLVDIGWKVLTISVVRNGMLQLNRSFEVSADDFIRALATNLELNMAEAEKVLHEHGLDPSYKEAFQAIVPVVDTIGDHIREVCSSFEGGNNEGQEQVSQVILCGGMASLLGLKEYLEASLGREVMIADPFQKIAFPEILKTRLKQLGPFFGVALGEALRGIE